MLLGLPPSRIILGGLEGETNEPPAAMTNSFAIQEQAGASRRGRFRPVEPSHLRAGVEYERSVRRHAGARGQADRPLHQSVVAADALAGGIRGSPRLGRRPRRSRLRPQRTAQTTWGSDAHFGRSAMRATLFRSSADAATSCSLASRSAVPQEPLWPLRGATRQSEGLLRVRGHARLRTSGPSPSGRSRTSNPSREGMSSTAFEAAEHRFLDRSFVRQPLHRRTGPGGPEWLCATTQAPWSGTRVRWDRRFHRVRARWDR